MKPEIKERIKMIERGEVPAGYKKTKIGICPLNWECKHIYEIADINPRKEKTDATTLVTFLGMSDISNSAKVKTQQEKSFAEVSTGFTAFRDNDVLIAKITPCFENGKGALVRGLKNGIGFGSTEFHVVRAKKSGNEQFIFLHSCSKRFRKIGEKYMTGTAGQRRLPMDFILSFLIGYPKDDCERKKIYECIETWDRTIDLKEKLLKQKKVQKKGLMERLLTGKVRLPGIYEKWEKKHLRDVFERVMRRNNEESTNVLTISGQRGLIRQKDYFNKSIASETLDNYFLLKQGEFAYNKSYSNGYPMGAIKRLDDYSKGVVTTLYICFKMKGNKDSSDFFQQYFEAGMMNKALTKVTQEGARAHGLLNISPNDFFELSMYIPAKAEQEAIANILVQSDKEIRLIEQNLIQLKTQKKGLMQLLLTGKVRVSC